MHAYEPLVLSTYHANDFAVKLLVIGDHLSKATSRACHALNQGGRDTAPETEWEDADITTLSLIGDILKHLLLRPDVSISEQHELSWHLLVTFFAASLYSFEGLCAAETFVKLFDVPASK
jgi:hypothetical protein